MGVYILSVMTEEVVDTSIISSIQKKIQVLFPKNEIKYSQYDYADRKFKELDFDINEISFNKESIHEEIMLLIIAIQSIFSNLEIDCDVIGGYNDTENVIMQYESDRDSNYKNWNLFATKKPISKTNVYYENDGLYFFQSFEYDSMGVIF